MEIRVYNPGDCFMVEQKPEDRLADLAAIDTMGVDNPMTAVTLFDGDTPVVVMGTVPAWPGVHQVWSIVDSSLASKGLRVIRTVRRLLDELLEQLDIRMFMAIIQESTPRNIRWIKIIGFNERFRITGAAPDGSDMIGFLMAKGEVCTTPLSKGETKWVQ